jgi:hypothetical protein
MRLEFLWLVTRNPAYTFQHSGFVELAHTASRLAASWTSPVVIIAIDNLHCCDAGITRLSSRGGKSHSGSLGASCGDSSAQFAGNEDEAHYGDQ